MSKNIFIIILVVIIAGLAFLKFKPQGKAGVAESKTVTQEVRKTPGVPPKAGDKLADLDIFKSAFQVFPGVLSEEAKVALIGFDIQNTKNDDGTTTVTFIPKGADDQKSSYKVAPGERLFFVEMSKGDDNASAQTDINLRDDYGVLVNADGIVQ